MSPGKAFVVAVLLLAATTLVRADDKKPSPNPPHKAAKTQKGAKPDGLDRHRAEVRDLDERDETPAPAKKRADVKKDEKSKRTETTKPKQ